VLSAKALVKYAVSRKKLQPGHAVQFVKTPERLERLPWIPSPGDFEKILGSVNTQTQTGLRNWLVVSLLAETGMTIPELCGLRWDACGEGFVSVEGKRPRRLAISAFAATRLLDWRSKISAPSSSSSLRAGKYLFPGFNRHGITSEKMTPRGVELFFRHLTKASGFRLLKPKTLRHYCIVDWLRQGVAESEIQKRLGVHAYYSLAEYKKVLEREQSL